MVSKLLGFIVQVAPPPQLSGRNSIKQQPKPDEKHKRPNIYTPFYDPYPSHTHCQDFDDVKHSITGLRLILQWCTFRQYFSIANPFLV